MGANLVLGDRFKPEQRLAVAGLLIGLIGAASPAKVLRVIRAD